MLRDFTYVDDIVTGIKNILPCPPQKDENEDQYKVYNIGNNKPEKLLTFIETLEEIIGIEAKKEYLPMQPGDVYQTYADVSELEKNFNFKPQTSIREGLTEFVNWYREFYHK